MARNIKETDLGLCVDDARKALRAAYAPSLGALRTTLARLAAMPPQVLLLEGGVEEERQSMALWWACLQHCQQQRHTGHDTALSPASGASDTEVTPNPAQNALNTAAIQHGEPCGQCPACLHIGVRIHPDVLAYDGRISNTVDAENPGPVRALNKENALTLKGKLGDTTRSGAKRVVIIGGIDTTRNAAANALLKVLEEPSPTTIFVLLTAQREQILPTLVSRSWVATLPWPSPHHVDASMRPWEEALATFLQRGQGWWQMTSTKGAVTAEIATNVLVLCQKRLITSLDQDMFTAQGSGQNSGQTGPLTTCFSKLSASKRLTVSHLLHTSQEALHYNVNPARVLEQLAAQLYCLLRQ